MPNRCPRCSGPYIRGYARGGYVVRACLYCGHEPAPAHEPHVAARLKLEAEAEQGQGRKGAYRFADTAATRKRAELSALDARNIDAITKAAQ